LDADPLAPAILLENTNMKKILAFTCVLAVLLLTCSKKSTNPPDDNNPPIDTTFSVSYSADEARAVQQNISAQSGGNVSATDKDGVQIRLDIPAHALASDADITIIPFSSLRISGPGASTCAGCTSGDSVCCFKGALFEPSGLVLDSPAILTIEFPIGEPLPFQKRGLIIYLDSIGNKYQACYTINDTSGKTLCARIRHFSGYGSGEENYDNMEAMIYQAAEQLLMHAGEYLFYGDPLWRMKDLHNLCRIPVIINGEEIVYPELTALIERLMLSAYDKHAKAVQTQALQSPPCDALSPLRLCIENLRVFVDPSGEGDAGWSNHDAFSLVQTSLLDTFHSLFRKGSADGKRMCEHDSCATGRDLIWCAVTGMGGRNEDDYIYAISDADSRGFRDTALDWLALCCRPSVNLEADKTTLYNLAVTPADSSDYVRFTATATDPFGPYAGAAVRVEGTHDNSGQTIIPSSGTLRTDDSGKFCATFVWDSRMSLPPGTATFKAAVQSWSDEADSMVWIWSEPVQITLKPVTISVSYSYSYTYSATSACGSTSASGLATSSDVYTIGVSDICQLRDKVSRAFSYETSCTTPGYYHHATETLIEPKMIPPCYWGYYLEERNLPGGWPSHKVLTHVAVSQLSPAYIQVERMNDNNGTVTVDTVWQDMWGTRPALDDTTYSRFRYPGREVTWDTTANGSTTTMRIGVTISR
jgi:hypothetical protein